MTTEQDAAHAAAHREVRAALTSHRSKSYALAAVAGTHHREAEAWIHGAGVTGALAPELGARLTKAAELLGIEPSAEHVERAAWALERRQKIAALAARVICSFAEAERWLQGNERGLDGGERDRFAREARALGIERGAKWGTVPVGELLPGVGPLPPMTGPDVDALRGSMRR